MPARRTRSLWLLTKAPHTGGTAVLQMSRRAWIRAYKHRSIYAHEA